MSFHSFPQMIANLLGHFMTMTDISPVPVIELKRGRKGSDISISEALSCQTDKQKIKINFILSGNFFKMS